ncbi:hypothetical protein [Gordonia sp. NPDC003950]
MTSVLTDVAVNDVVARCEQLLARAVENPTVRGWNSAVEAAGANDADAAARALADMPEQPRFVATLVLGLAFPAVLGTTAVALDESLPRSPERFDWSDCCELLTVVRWAERASELDATVLARICGRAYWRSAGIPLLAAVRVRLASDDVTSARRLYDAIPEYAVQEKAAACALLVVRGITTPDDAITDAIGNEIIQVGYEEAQALSCALTEYARAGIEPDAAAVVSTVEAMTRWGADRVEKDGRSAGLAIGAQACVRAGWLDHARTLADVLWDARNRDPVLAAIASGVGAPELVRILHHEPDLDEIRAETDLDRRLEDASARALGRFDTGDADAAIAALTTALNVTAAAAEAVDGSDLVTWARMLATGGDQDSATRIMTDLMPDKRLPRVGYQCAVDVLDADHGRAFLDAALSRQRELDMLGTATARTSTASYLARVVVRADDPDLELRFLRAVVAVAPREKVGLPRPSNFVENARAERIIATLRILDAARRGEDDAASLRRLEEWTRILPEPEQPWIAAAAVAYTAQRREVFAPDNAVPRPECLPGVAAELARRGRLEDALELVSRIALHDSFPEVLQQRTLVAVAEATSGESTSVIDAYRTCQETWDREDDEITDIGRRQFYLGTIMLACGDIDGAIDTAAQIPDVRQSHCGAGDLVAAIGAHLDTHPHLWTPERAQRLADTLGGEGIGIGDLMHPLMAIGPSVMEHHPQPFSLLVGARRKFSMHSGRGDSEIVRALEGLGLIRAGQYDTGIRCVTTAIAAAADSVSSMHYSYPQAYAQCAFGLPRDADDRDESIRRVCRLAEGHNPERTVRRVGSILNATPHEDLPLVATTLADLQVPHETMTLVHNRIGVALIRHADDPTLFPLESAPDRDTALVRVRQVAQFLARRGRLIEANALAAQCGLDV